MKNIIICFDGTWNTADAEFPTNVVKIAQMVTPTDAQGVAQVLFYDEGVGSMEVAYGSKINKLLGGAFGAGLMENIERAYRFLIFNYAPGDRIFLFGFSRGAFSARSFGGLLRTCGILRKDRIGQIKDAIALYQNRDREAGADAGPCVTFRRENSYASYSGGTGETGVQHPLSIEYIGVWDTVGALGVPTGFFFANRFNKKYQFHDLALSSMVKSTRHALAIDERRRTFTPTAWSNLDDLNSAAGPSLHGAPLYNQVWFPGDHASIGGGGTVNGLWQAALLWVVEGAQFRSLAIEEAKLNEYLEDIDYKASVNTAKRFGFSSISLRRWRTGPAGQSLDEVSEVGQQRIKAPANELYEKQLYRPPPLQAYIEAFSRELGIS